MNNNKEIITKQRVIVVKDVFREQNDNKIKDFNGYHAIAYAGSQLFHNPIRESCVFSINTLCDIAGVEYSAIKNNIKDALFDLAEWGLLEIETINNKKINTNTTVSVKVPHIDKNKSKFTTINYDFVLKVLESDKTITEKGNMLTIYMVLAQYMGNDVIAYPSIEIIMEDSNLSVNTVNNILRLLKELKIIEYGNKGLYMNKNGTMQNSNNIYIFMDIEGVEKVIKHHIGNKKEKDDKATKETEKGIVINENKNINSDSEPEKDFIDYTQIKDVEPTKEEIIDSLFG